MLKPYNFEIISTSLSSITSFDIKQLSFNRVFELKNSYCIFNQLIIFFSNFFFNINNFSNHGTICFLLFFMYLSCIQTKITSMDCAHTHTQQKKNAACFLCCLLASPYATITITQNHHRLKNNWFLDTRMNMTRFQWISKNLT